MPGIPKRIGSHGGMKLPSWDQTFEFSKSEAVKNAWGTFFSKYFPGQLLKIEDYENDMAIQTQSWDWALIFSNHHPILRAELKTRQPWVYDYFQKDHQILIETKGNVDAGKGGSAIYHSNAELWCYGFFVNNEIYEGFVFKREELAKWLEYNEGNYKKQYSNTSNYYRTEFVLIPLFDIEEFVFKLPTGLDGFL